MFDMLKGLDIYDFYDKMEQKNIMLSFKGAITPELLSSILTIVEKKLENFDCDKTTKKKVFYILVECLQNLYHHSEGMLAKDSSKTKDSSVIVMIAQNVTGYSIVTGNYVLQNNVTGLRNKLESINNLSREELKTLYQEVLQEGGLSEKGGGGLGIIDIARKSGEKLEYGFIPVDDNNSFFSLNVKIV